MGGIGPRMFSDLFVVLEAEVEGRKESGSKVSRLGCEDNCSIGDWQCTGIILDHIFIFFIVWIPAVELHIGTSGMSLGSGNGWICLWIWGTVRE
jgi:hypothetical protein